MLTIQRRGIIAIAYEGAPRQLRCRLTRLNAGTTLVNWVLAVGIVALRHRPHTEWMLHFHQLGYLSKCGI